MLCTHTTMKGSKVKEDDANFWRENTKPLPGRPTSDRDFKNVSQKKCSQVKHFQDFQESVSDVWDTKDDEFYQVFNQRHPKHSFFSVHGYTKKDMKVGLIDEVAKCTFLSKSWKGGDFAECVGLHKPTLPSNQISHSCGEKCGKSRVNKENVREPILSKAAKFKTILESSLLSLDSLRLLSWSGVVEGMRPTVWRLLAGYLPTSLDRRKEVLERKRIEYWNLVHQYFDSKRDEEQEDTFRQIHIDVPRMTPLTTIFSDKTVQQLFERVLFVWAIRHPASGYVQGMNDLVTPFFVVFLREIVPLSKVLDAVNLDCIPKEELEAVEADTFWCFSKFLDGIQDNYIFAQLGIQEKVNQLKELIQRIDKDLHQHLEQHGIDYLQFSFRWMNNLLTREIPLECCIRLWDTYLAEVENFAMFQLYVCAAFLLHWRHELMLQSDFQNLIMLLQNLPTHKWTDADVALIVAEAYKLKFMFADAPNHLQPRHS